MVKEHSPRAAVRRLALSRFVSMAGTDATGVAIGFALYAQTRSAAWLSLSLMLTVGAGALLAPLGGRAGDFVPRRRLMIGAELTAATVFVALALMHTPAALLALGVLATAIGTVFGPASGAAIAHVAGERELSWASGLVATGANVGKMAGRLVAGALIAILGVGSVFVLDAITFLFSAWLIASVRRAFSAPLTGPPPGEPEPASRQGGLIGSLAGESAGVQTEQNGIRGYAHGSDVFFHTNANPRHRLSMIERTVEQAWASAYNLRHTINTGLPITSTDAKAWQTRWPSHLYHDAMLQAQLRSQMIEGPVEARFTLSLNRKLYNHARVALTASAVKNLSAAQSGGLLDWESPAQPGTQGIDASFLCSVKSTGFAGLGQGELFARNLIFGRDKIIKDSARPLGVLQALGGAAEYSRP